MKKGILFLLILAAFFVLNGCSERVEKYTFTQEELEELQPLPKYKVFIGDQYLKLEKKNQGEHLIPLDLLRIAFPEYLKDIPDDGISRYIKKELILKIPGIKVQITDDVLEINSNDSNNFKQVLLNSEEIHGHIFIVNQNFVLDRDFVGENLTEMKGPYIQPLYNNMKLAEEALVHLQRMASDFNKELDTSMIIVSAYRDFNHQERIFTNRIALNKKNFGLSDEDAYKKASEIIAIPGTSEHQSGLAIDFSNKSLVQSGRALVNDFSKTEEGSWLAKNAYQYGFILRYPRDKTDITKIVFEPWHYRYVGRPHSDIIFEKNLTLEEYLEDIQEKGKIERDDYILFYLDPLKILSEEIYYSNEIEIENDNRGGWILTKKK